MLFPVLFSLAIIFVTILIHGIGTTWIVKWLMQKHVPGGENRYGRAMYSLSMTAIFLMILHFVEITVWAIVFMFIPEVDQIQTFEQAIYFSMVTYATLGYGDITLAPFWRIMSGFEDMDGILLF